MDLPPPHRPQINGHDLVTRGLSYIALAAIRATTEEARHSFNRYAIHGLVLGLVIALIVLGRSLPLSGSGVAAGATETTSPLINITFLTPAPITSQPPLATGGPLRRTFRSGSDVEVIQRYAQPHTEIPHRLRLNVITYTVQPGDTVQGIAIMYGLQDTTIMWANPAIEDMPDYLRIGQQVVILPIDGVYHTVKAGDTLESIAQKYKVDVSAITDVSYNNLQPPDYPIEPGMKLIVAGGQKPYVPKIVTAYTGPVPEGARGTGLFQWPAIGNITQEYWWGHRALDIAAYTGAPIYAADGGFVSFAGWTDVGYGYLIIIDHANGFATYYAHCHGFYVSVGQKVERGQLIAAMGSTGNSTGPHVHFEIRSGITPLNPRVYLP